MDQLPPASVPAYPKQETSGLAIASIICGLLGFLTFGLTGIAAVITGHIALSAIKRSAGRVGGKGMAITGLVTGYMTLCIVPVAAVAGLAAPVILKQRQAADLTECRNRMQMVHLAIVEFEADHGSVPSDATAGKDARFAGMTGPRVLGQLQIDGRLPDIEKFLAMKASHSGDWHYFPQADLKVPGDLLISPAVGEKHLVLGTDGKLATSPRADLRTRDLSAAIAIPAPLARK